MASHSATAAGTAILVCDSSDRMAVIRNLLNRHGITTFDAGDGSSALTTAKRHDPDYIFACVELPDSSGLKVIQSLKHRYPLVFGAIVGPDITPEKRREIMREGADAYIEASGSESDINASIRRLTARKETGILGRDEKVLQAIETVESIAPTKVTVLITGESGTGKELIARAIHLRSDRREGPFIAVNCGALPEGVLESEIFGHEKGSFTGATAQRKGRFEIADGGTLLLDEVGEMPLATQVRLLRVLEEEPFMRVGGSQDVKVDVRVIAASNRDLRYLVEEGTFRRDLYYRLNVVHIHVPALRERRDDIATIFLGLVEEARRRNNLSFGGITREAMDVLQAYDWPGNVREVKNLAESLLVLSQGKRIGLGDLPEHVVHPDPLSRDLPVRVGRPRHEIERDLLLGRLAGIEHRVQYLTELVIGLRNALTGGAPPPREEIIRDGVSYREVPDAGELVIEPGTPIKQVEQELIARTLEEVGGNRKKAAKLLGIGERTLYRRMKEYGLS
jgi:DNA-binding NtrC family response regulator